MGRQSWWRGGGRGRGRGGYSSTRGRNGPSNTTTPKKSSIGIDLFTIMGARSASTSGFEDIQNLLAQWISSQAYPLGSVAGKMVRTLQDVEFEEPVKPIRVTKESWEKDQAKKVKDEGDAPDEEDADDKVAAQEAIAFDDDAAREDYVTALERYRAALKKYDLNISQWAETNSKVFEIVRGQCSPELTTTIFSDPSWSKIEEEYDTVAFLIAIRDACGRLNHMSEGREVTCVHLDMNLMTCLMGKDETLLLYYKRFNQAVDQNRMNGGTPGYHDAMYQRELAAAHDAHPRFCMTAIEDLEPDQVSTLQETAMSSCTNKYLAILFIKLAHPVRFGHVTTNLNNSSLINRVSSWPIDLPAALDLLLNFERDNSRPNNNNNDNNNNNNRKGFRIPHPPPDSPSVNNEGVAFMQTQGRRGPTCYFCLGDHIIKFCDHPEINQATCNAIYTHRSAGTYRLPLPGTVWHPPPAQLTGVGGRGVPTGVGGHGSTTGVAQANITNNNDDATSVMSEATYASRQAAYAQANPGQALPSPNEMANMLGFPSFLTVGTITPLPGVNLMHVGSTSAMDADTDDDEAALAGSDDDNPIEDLLYSIQHRTDEENVTVPTTDPVIYSPVSGHPVVYGPDPFPETFNYIRVGILASRTDLLLHGLHYSGSASTIAAYESVDDRSIVDEQQRYGIAGRGCVLVAWKYPTTYRKVISKDGNILTHGRVGKFQCILTATGPSTLYNSGEEVLVTCHDYVYVPGGTTIHSLKQMHASHPASTHALDNGSLGFHRCLLFKDSGRQLEDEPTWIERDRTVPLVGYGRRQIPLRRPTVADITHNSYDIGPDDFDLSFTTFTESRHTRRDDDGYARPLHLFGDTSTFCEGQTYHELNGHFSDLISRRDYVTYSALDEDWIPRTVRLTNSASNVEAHLHSVTRVTSHNDRRLEARTLRGINHATHANTGFSAAAGAALSSPAHNGRSDCLPWWKVFLDSCATYHVSYVPSILTDMRDAGSVLQGSCNAGATRSSRQGMLGGRFLMWYNPGGIANLLSLPLLVKEGYVIKYQSDSDGWVVTTPGPSPIDIPFTSDNEGVTAGMPYIDVRQYIDGLAMIQTVEHNMEGFTSREVREAYTAREAQARLGHPSTAQMRQLVSSNSLLNCPVTPQAITNADSIFGPDLGSLRGKSVRTTPNRVIVEPAVVSDDFYRLHKFVTLVADVMFVNGLAFFVTRSLRIKLITAECMNTRTAAELGKSLTKIVQIYDRGGYTVRCALMDKEFDKIKDRMNSVTINTTAAREHVPEIERAIRDVKNRARAVLSVLPYDYYHRQIIIHLVYFVVRMINAVPSKVGISQILSPSEIVQGWKLNFPTHCRFPFGTYLEASFDDDITNTMKPRTEPCIHLGTTGNIQGSVHCLSLRTGKVIVRRTVKELPFPPRILGMVKAWGLVPQSRDYERRLAVLDRHKQPISDDGDDVPPSPLAPQKLQPDSTFEIPGVSVAHDDDVDADDAIEEDDEIIDVPLQPTFRERAAAARVSFSLDDTVPSTTITSPDRSRSQVDRNEYVSNSVDASSVSSEDDEDESRATATPFGSGDDIVVETVQDEPDEVEPDEDEPDITTLPTSRRRAAPTRYTPSFNNKHYDVPGSVHFSYHGDQYTANKNGVMLLNVMDDNPDRTPVPMSTEDIDDHVLGIALIEQYSLKRATKTFGAESSNAAVSKELNQIHDMETYVPIDSRSLSLLERKQALNALLFLTQKRDGTIKARKCADGSKQRFNEGYVKSDGSAPTVATDSVLITSAMEAHNHCDIATIDLPGAFLHTDNDEDTIMLLRGKLAELLVQIDPTVYRKYVITSSRGEPMLYVKLQKAIYGLLRSALLFYRKLALQLVNFGFTINPYDPCVATKVIPTDSHTEACVRANHYRFAPKDGSKPLVIESTYSQTVTMHVDDLKVSHVDPKVNDAFIEHFKHLYNRDSLKPVSVRRGKIHDYLGIDLDFTHVGNVRISMIKYSDKIFNDFPEQICTTAPPSTPAANHLFDIRDDNDPLKRPLNEEQSGHFHRAVAQLLFLCMRSRRDIQTAISFLTTRVRAPDEDDWNKLVRVLKYLYGTRHMKLTLSVHNMSTVKWWVDASYGTHWDCKGHTGMMMSLGKGAVLSSSRKQKLNTKSSTESELVGVDDVISKILWGKYFIESLGYTVDQNILLQDNKSTILLAKNGKLSSSSKTKHIKHRYFFITDKIAKGDLEVEYEPTTRMWSDILTKPLQGQLFLDMRAQLMNVDSNYNDDYERTHTHPDLLPDSTTS